MIPNLNSYDVILINTSAGKDSQAMLDYVVEHTRAAGAESKLVAVHCDLGRVEWTGTRDLAAEQVAHYGVRFEVVSRPQGDLLTHVESRGLWPSSAARYCTSDHKRGQVYKLLTKLVREIRDARKAAGESKADSKRPVRILNCMGIRADESRERRKRVPFEFDTVASNGKRHVDEWLPIFTWSEAQVWERIKVAGTRSHFAYSLGMPRLSCVFCIFAPPPALVIAGTHNRALLDEYVRVERAIDHTFTNRISLVQIAAQVDSGVIPTGPIEWGQCG